MGVWYNFTLTLNNTDPNNDFTAYLDTVLTYPGTWNVSNPQVLMYRDNNAMTFIETSSIDHEYSIGTISASQVISWEMAFFIIEGSDIGSYGVQYSITGVPHG